VTVKKSFYSPHLLVKSSPPSKKTLTPTPRRWKDRLTKWFTNYTTSHRRRLQSCGGKGNTEILYSEKSSKQFARIKKGDRKSTALIIEAIEAYAENPSGNFDVKILKGKYEDLKRLRVGNYRIIFEDDGNTMSIYEVKHRQEAYQ